MSAPPPTAEELKGCKLIEQKACYRVILTQSGCHKPDVYCKVPGEVLAPYALYLDGTLTTIYQKRVAAWRKVTPNNKLLGALLAVPWFHKEQDGWREALEPYAQISSALGPQKEMDSKERLFIGYIKEED